jgi:uncharacterized membrane protein (DUF485 family)
MSQQPLPSHHEDHPHVVTRNARYGLILFGIYVILYLGFMYCSAFKPEWMASLSMAGVNGAVWYGFGLIVAALLLALIYMVLCRSTANDPNQPAGYRSDT